MFNPISVFTSQIIFLFTLSLCQTLARKRLREKQKGFNFTIAYCTAHLWRMSDSAKSRVDVLMIGSGEYTTGYVHGKASQSDKSKGGIE